MEYGSVLSIIGLILCTGGLKGGAAVWRRTECFPRRQENYTGYCGLLAILKGMEAGQTLIQYSAIRNKNYPKILLCGQRLSKGSF